MKDPSYNIRVAVSQLLSTIEYNGKPVLVFDEIVSADAGFPRIVLLDVTGGSGGRITRCGFGDTWSQVIKISTSFTGRASKNSLDLISNEVLEMLVPFGGEFMDIGPDFNVWKVEGSVVANQSYSDGVRQYIDKNLRITYSVTEK